jgi:xanthine dehydrogenase accessory factor
MSEGEPLLLRILPPSDVDFPETAGARVMVNPCLSGGAIEIFLEPRLPAPMVAIVGETPIADATAQMAESLGFIFESVRTLDDESAQGAIAVVISNHGGDEPESIRTALAAGVPFIGLVASPARGAALLDAMELTAAERARIRTPVGLDIGARTPEEIALSIMAEVVQEWRRGQLREASARLDEVPLQSVDPVCGMTVVVRPDTPHRVVAGADIWFCSPGCRDRFAA